MAIRLSPLEIQEITRLVETGTPLPEKYRDALFADQQLHPEDSVAQDSESVALPEMLDESSPPKPVEARSGTAFTRFLLDDPQIQAVIRSHVESVVPARNLSYRKNQPENLAVKCLYAIRALLPTVLGQREPGIDGYLLRWKDRKELPTETASEMYQVIRNKLAQRESAVTAECKAREKAAEIEGAEGLLWTHSEVVNKFLDIAERKVSVRDEYGDERIHLLAKEVDDCVAKIAGREGFNEGFVRSELKRGLFMRRLPKEFKQLRVLLTDRFAKFHAEQKGKKKRIDELASLTGIEFETAVGNVLSQNGWHVSATASSGDQGADIIASKGERKVIIQAKRYSRTVGNKAVQEVVGAVLFYDGTEGCVITNSTFTPAARALAQKNNVRLIDGTHFELLSDM